LAVEPKGIRVFMRQTVMSKSYPFVIGFVGVVLVQLAGVAHICHARKASPALQMRYTNHALQIITKNVDLRSVLDELAKTVGIVVSYPVSLNKKVTMNRQAIPVGQALKEILKGINYVVIYSGPSQQHAEIEEVIVMTKSRQRQLPPGKARRLNQQINRYNRQIKSLQQRSVRVAPDSRQGKRYNRQIKRLQGKIERLERQLY
jgi:hypothetical protein